MFIIFYIWQMKVDIIEIKENFDSRFCVYFSIEDDFYDVQFYFIFYDFKEIFRVDGFKFCLIRKVDFEEKLIK